MNDPLKEDTYYTGLSGYTGGAKMVIKSVIDKRNKKISGGARPAEKQFYNAAKSSYQPRGEPNIGNGFKLFADTRTLDFFIRPSDKTILIGVRGTVLTDFNDIKADASLLANNLKNTNRYTIDKNKVAEIINKYPDYQFYLSGHSLGKAIVTQLKRDFPILKEAVGFNGAFQPTDLVAQDPTIDNNYVKTDFLYNMGGRFFKNVKVIPPNPEKSRGFFSFLKKTFAPRSISGHSLNNFRGLYGGSKYTDKVSQGVDFAKRYNSYLTGSRAFYYHTNKADKDIAEGEVKKPDDIDLVYKNTMSQKLFDLLNKDYKRKKGDSPIDKTSQGAFVPKEDKSLPDLDIIKDSRLNEDDYNSDYVIKPTKLMQNYKGDYFDSKDFGEVNTDKKRKYEILESIIPKSSPVGRRRRRAESTPRRVRPRGRDMFANSGAGEEAPSRLSYGTPPSGSLSTETPPRTGFSYGTPPRSGEGTSLSFGTPPRAGTPPLGGGNARPRSAPVFSDSESDSGSGGTEEEEEELPPLNMTEDEYIDSIFEEAGMHVDYSLLIDLIPRFYGAYDHNMPVDRVVSAVIDEQDLLKEDIRNRFLELSSKKQINYLMRTLPEIPDEMQEEYLLRLGVPESDLYRIYNIIDYRRVPAEERQEYLQRIFDGENPAETRFSPYDIRMYLLDLGYSQEQVNIIYHRFIRIEDPREERKKKEDIVVIPDPENIKGVFEPEKKGDVEDPLEIKNMSYYPAISSVPESKEEEDEGGVSESKGGEDEGGVSETRRGDEEDDDPMTGGSGRGYSTPPRRDNPTSPPRHNRRSSIEDYTNVIYDELRDTASPEQYDRILRRNNVNYIRRAFESGTTPLTVVNNLIDTDAQLTAVESQSRRLVRDIVPRVHRVSSRLEDFEEDPYRTPPLEYGSEAETIIDGSGKNDIDFNDLKWGSFTKQFEAFNRQHKKNKKRNLKSFAKWILMKKNADKSTEKTKRRARFYLNVIDKRKK